MAAEEIKAAEERESLVLTRRPFATLKFFFLELAEMLHASGRW